MFIATSKFTNAETSSLEQINASWVLSIKSSKYMHLYSENYLIYYIAMVIVHLKLDVAV